MKRVFVVQHLHVLPGEEEDVKLIGVYSSRGVALAAVARVGGQPGFRESPRLVNPEIEGSSAEGFYVDEYVIDRDHWEEGFVTA